MSNALELAQLASLVTVDASSNIGIGTTTSARSALLTIKDPNQNITSGNGQLAIITSDAVGANIGGALILGGQSAGAADWVFGSISGRSENNAYAGYLSFGVSNAAGSHAEAMRITSGGTVGIGTTAPGAMLDIDGGAGNLVIRRYGAQPSTSWFRAEGTQASPTAIASSSTIAQLVARGYDGASYRITSYMDFISDGAISSTSSPGYIRFWTTPSGTVSPVERLRIDSAGNVGIGVTPSYRLDVRDTATTASNVTAAILSTALANGNFNQLYLGRAASANASATFTYSYNSTTPASSYLSLGLYSSSYSLNIDGSGNVGIGTTSPQQKLDVVGNGALIGARPTSNTSASMVMAQGSDYYSTPSYVATYLQQYSSAATGTTLGYSNANLGMLVFQNAPGMIYTGGSAPIVFGTLGTERMRLDASGNLLIGYTTVNGAYKLQVNSQIFATSATIATSDGSYKENVVPLTGALDLVNALNPVQFSWKEHPVHNFDRAQPTVGFIAQEVQEVLKDAPYVNSIVKTNETELPDGTKEGFLGIAEGNMIALLTKAIQELKAENDALKTRVIALENK